ncbi:hypothetical protein [Clostridium saccharoperbutylacetonicum]|uniref:hypothetical protein n=1 Tax=Clostridium saccharoperbutylacetonicum TaxID=36745 RepID=UPI0039ED514D
MKKIRLDNSVVNRIKIESPEKMETSFFKEEYAKANVQIKDIIRLQKNNKEKKQNIRENDCKNDNKNEDEDISNNIIAFIGERGSGKSSAMLSFKGKILSEGVDIDVDDEKKVFDNINFHAIDNIDPSIMNNNDSIIELIVGQMFKNYKDACKNKHSLYERHLVNCFEKVFSDLKLLNDEYKYSEMGDDLENLINISSAVSLHNNFRELVENYLKYIDENDSEKSNYLLISIDDLDLNLSAAQLMLEDIRKFLIQDNIIILMAIKLEQLEEVLIQKNISDLKIYEENYICKLEDKEVKDKFLNDIRNKAIKYLEKILPYNIRIILPKIDVDDVEMEFEDEFKKLNHYKDKDESKKSIKETIVNIYFKKYRYIIGSDSHLKEIMPSNLRGWIQLFDFLSKEESKGEQPDDGNKEKTVNKDEVSKENYLNNIQNLKNYYISHVEKEIESIVIKNNLLEFFNCPIEELNKNVFIFINDYIMKNTTIIEYEEKKKEESIVEDAIELNLRKRFILKNNVSLGFVITWIKLYENYMDSGTEVKIIEIIKLILSIRYLEIYLVNRNSNDKKDYKYKLNLVDIIGRDFEGRYFELVRNKHVGKNRSKSFNRFYSDTERIGSRISTDYILFNKDLINKITIDKKLFIEESNGYILRGGKFEKKLLRESECSKNELKDINKIKSLLNMYFNIFEPQFQDQWKTRNSIFYRNEFSLDSDWISKYRLTKYWFKPLNIIGNQYLECDKFDEDVNLINSNYIQPILFVININYFMELLKHFNTNINKKRPSNKPVEFLKEVINVLNLSIEEKFENLSTVMDAKEHKELLKLAQIKLLRDEKIGPKAEKSETEKFLEMNITYNRYSDMAGYNLDYDDQDEEFLYYSIDKLRDIQIDIKYLNNSEENYIVSLRAEIDNILKQIEIIKERVETKKNQIKRPKKTANVTKKIDDPITKLLEKVQKVEGEINSDCASIDKSKIFNNKICNQIEKIYVAIEEFNASQED